LDERSQNGHHHEEVKLSQTDRDPVCFRVLTRLGLVEADSPAAERVVLRLVVSIVCPRRSEGEPTVKSQLQGRDLYKRIYLVRKED
jgi:hypothetical protein